MDRQCIGITGGIGTGKSSVSRLLAAYCNRPLIDLDHCCRRLLDRGEPGWQALNSVFGPRFFDPQGRLDRSGLREALFSEPAIKREVDALLHPLARSTMHRLVREQQQELIFIEIPLLYEAGWQEELEAVIVVHADLESQCRRIVQRDGVSPAQAQAAVASQMPLGEKVARADYTIDNSGPWRFSRQAVIALARLLEKEVPPAPESPENT
ncbi:dephospho-CoA kinase [Desulfogranum mediterraneum]|uniref:dephospho-CoA kinase n=1 Tax=Desulfogranum mediterraneum TaxID=160661 RepID=UPI00041EB932|nr:dephospho-CoA kinase [Desulfogranum mediterraneum]